jgi:pantothenate kinase type III
VKLEEHKGRVTALAAELERVARAHVDSLPPADGAEILFMGLFLGFAGTVLEIVRRGGTEPTVDELARALHRAPFQAAAQAALEANPPKPERSASQ